MHGYGETVNTGAVRANTRTAFAFLAVPAPYALAVVVLGAFVLRLTLALTHEGQLGPDGGAYLLSAQHWLYRLGLWAHDVPTVDVSRPPLSPGLWLGAFIKPFGLDMGFRLFTAVGSIVPVLCCIPLFRRFLSPWQVVAATALLAVDMNWAEMTVTGVLPLIGFGLFALILWGLCGLTKEWRWREALTVVAVVPLLAFTNQTATGLAFICISIFVLFLFFTKGMEYIDGMAAAVVAGGILALASLWWYAFPGTDKTLSYPGPVVYLTHGFGFVWWQMAALGTLAILAIRKARDIRLRAIGVLSIALVLLMPWASYDESVMNIFYRARFLAPIPTVLLGTWAYARYVAPQWRPVALASLAVTVALAGLLGWAWEFRGQASAGDMVTPAVAPMVEYVRDNPNGAVLTNGFSLSLWTAALTGEKTYWTWQIKPPLQYQAEDEVVRCALGWVATCTPAEAVRQLGVGYVLTDARMQLPANVGPTKIPLYGAPSQNPWNQPIPNATLVMQDGTAKLWKLNG